jgi:hypothetical protein
MSRSGVHPSRMSESLKMLLSGMQPSRTARRPALCVSRCGELLEKEQRATGGDEQLCFH